jgi:hypothetical protein
VGGDEVCAVVQVDLELSSPKLDAANIARIKVRDAVSLVPQTVVNEAFEGDRSGEMIATDRLISVQGQGGMRVRDMRRGPSGT